MLGDDLIGGRVLVGVVMGVEGRGGRKMWYSEGGIGRVMALERRPVV